MIDTNIIHTYIVLWKIGKRGVVDLHLFEIIRGLLLLISHVLGIIIHLLIWSGILEQGKGRDAVLQPARSTFIVSILTLSLYSYLYVPHSLSAYWVNIIMCRRSITTDFIWSSFTPRRRANIVNVSLPVIWSIKASNWGQYPRFLWTCYK